MVIQLKWNSQILNDFKQVFYWTSNIFKNPSDPMVSKEFGFEGIWIACVMALFITKFVPFVSFWNCIVFDVLFFAHTQNSFDFWHTILIIKFGCSHIFYWSYFYRRWTLVIFFRRIAITEYLIKFIKIFIFFWFFISKNIVEHFLLY